MSRSREENRKIVRKRKRERRIDPGSDDEDVSVRSSRRGYESRPSRRPGDRYDREYHNYSMYEDRYNGWQDIYRPDYYRNQYSDYGGGYGYGSSRRGYDGYYDNYRPSYYDYDSGGSRSDCMACSHRNGRGGGRMGYDPYIYHYEEERRPRPRERHERSRKPKRMSDDPREPERTKNRNDVNVFAMHNVSGQDGFKDKKNGKKLEPVRSEVRNVSEHDLKSRERQSSRRPRQRRLEYDDC